MSCWVFFRRCSLCRGLANTAMHLTRPLLFPHAQRGPEPAVFCGQMMASVNFFCLLHLFFITRLQQKATIARFWSSPIQ